MKESERADRNVDAKAIIEAVLNHVGMRAPSFAKTIGINYQRIFDLQSGRTKKFNPGVVNLICAKFPDINKTYLYTGEGNLVLPGFNSPTTEQLPGSGPSAQLAEMISMQRKLMEMFQSITEREAKLQDKMTELLDRERVLDEREKILSKRESEMEQLLNDYGLKKGSQTMEA